MNNSDTRLCSIQLQWQPGHHTTPRNGHFTTSKLQNWPKATSCYLQPRPAHCPQNTQHRLQQVPANYRARTAPKLAASPDWRFSLYPAQRFQAVATLRDPGWPASAGTTSAAKRAVQQQTRQNHRHCAAQTSSAGISHAANLGAAISDTNALISRFQEPTHSKNGSTSPKKTELYQQPRPRHA